MKLSHAVLLFVGVVCVAAAISLLSGLSSRNLDDLAPLSEIERPAITSFRVGENNVRALLVEGEDVWIGTSGGLVRFQPKTGAHHIYDNKVDGILSNAIFHLSSYNNQLLVGTYGGGLSVLDLATEQWRNLNIPQGLADQFVYDIELANNGDLWIATWSGVNRIRKGELFNEAAWALFTVENTQGGLPNPWVYAIEQDQQDNLWFATEGGLARFDGKEWQSWTHEDGLGASLEQGESTFDESSLNPGVISSHHAAQKQQQGLQHISVAYNPNYIVALAIDGEDNVWAGTWGAGLAQYDGTQWINYTTDDGLPSNHVFALHIDAQQQLWVGTSKGLSRLNKTSKDFVAVDHELATKNIFVLADDASEGLWVGGYGGVSHVANAQ